MHIFLSGTHLHVAVSLEGLTWCHSLRDPTNQRSHGCHQSRYQKGKLQKKNGLVKLYCHWSQYCYDTQDSQCLRVSMGPEMFPDVYVYVVRHQQVTLHQTKPEGIWMPGSTLKQDLSVWSKSQGLQRIFGLSADSIASYSFSFLQSSATAKNLCGTFL